MKRYTDNKEEIIKKFNSVISSFSQEFMLRKQKLTRRSGGFKLLTNMETQKAEKLQTRSQEIELSDAAYTVTTSAYS